MSVIDWLAGFRRASFHGRRLGRGLKRIPSALPVMVSTLEPRRLLSGVSANYDGNPVTQGSMGTVFGDVVGTADFGVGGGGDVEIDENGDGTPDYSGSTDGNGGFRIAVPLAFGHHSLQTRAIGYDEEALPVVGSWSSFNVDLDPPANDPPSVQNLTYAQGSPSMFYASGMLTGDIDDDHPLNTFTIEIDADGNGTADETADPTSANFNKNLVLSYGHYTLNVRAVEFDIITGNTLTGSWESLDIDVTPPDDDAPIVSGLNFTITAINYGSGKGILSGSVNDDGVGDPTYTLEFDLNDDGHADSTSEVSYNSNGTTFIIQGFEVPFGDTTIKVRATEINPFTGVLLAGAWASVDVSVENHDPVLQGGTDIPLSISGAVKQYNFSIEENKTAVVGSVTATDSDLRDEVHYELVSGSNGVSINADTGAITVGNQNFEVFKVAGVEPTFTVTVKAYDTNGGYKLADVVITVMDVFNEPDITWTPLINLGSPNAVADGAVDAPQSWIDPNSILGPTIEASQLRGTFTLIGNWDTWSQPASCGSGKFTPSNSGNCVTSTVSLTAASGNVCNSVDFGNGAYGSSGTLKLTATGFAAGTYTFVLEVKTTISITPTVTANGGSRLSAAVGISDTQNGVQLDSTTGAPVTKSQTDWIVKTVTLDSSTDRENLVTWLPTIAFETPGTTTITGQIRIAEITKD